MPTVKMTHVLRFVPDVEEALTFYSSALGLERTFLHDGGDYGELNGGTDTALSFAADALIESHGIDFRKRANASNADATEFDFECEDINATYAAAVAAGATGLKAPTAMPWGQTIAYLSDPWGHLIGLGQWDKKD